MSTGYRSLDETGLALPVVYGELLPGLPPAGVAASNDALELAEGSVREWLLHPERALKPEAIWPEAERAQHMA